MKTIDKVMQCLNWMDNEYNNKMSDNYDSRLSPKKVSENIVRYYDIEENTCILKIDGDNIDFDGQSLSFEEFLMLLTGDDEYIIEVMLDEIDLD